MDTQQTQSHEQTTPSTPVGARDFAFERAQKQDRSFEEINDRLAKLSSRVEDVVNMTGEIGAHVLPETNVKRNAFAKAVHFLDSKLTSALPYIRVGAAAVAAGGVAYGGFKGAQAGYRWATKKPDAQAMPVGEPISVG